jgi:hypothetical protein
MALWMPLVVRGSAGRLALPKEPFFFTNGIGHNPRIS